MERLLGQWVHRHGLNQVQALSDELAAADPDAWAWWQVLQSPTIAPVEMAVLPKPQLPHASRPAPAPSHPAVVQLRTWLPDREERRAA